jgi:hypothetical protein
MCEELDTKTWEFYRQVLVTLQEANLPFLVGGAFALRCYTGIVRHTKDLDIFTRPEDYPRVLEKLAGLGYRTEVTDLQWLAKAFSEDDYADIIFGSGKGFAAVDDAWFDHAVDGQALDLQVRLIPVEEMTWSKAFIMERERYDGADVAHLLRARGTEMDWRRLLQRFGVHWRVLLSHLTLFHYIYPGEHSQIPHWVLEELGHRFQEQAQAGPPPAHVCHGTFLSNTQYLIDLERWGYQDGRWLQGARSPG